MSLCALIKLKPLKANFPMRCDGIARHRPLGMNAMDSRHTLDAQCSSAKESYVP